jgi:hypothetical protein
LLGDVAGAIGQCVGLGHVNEEASACSEREEAGGRAQNEKKCVLTPGEESDTGDGPRAQFLPFMAFFVARERAPLPACSGSC